MKHFFAIAFLCFSVFSMAQNSASQTTKKRQIKIQAQTKFNQVIDAKGNIIATSKPLFAFEGGSSFDFGEVPQTEKIYHDFVFTNTGFEPLIISKVSSSCYCISSNWDKTPILPGQKGKIRVWYDTRSRKGNFRNGVTIYSNAYSYPDETLLVSGKVMEALGDE